MIDPESPIPPPRGDDDEDVHWALSTASALWARGDAGESIKWLRRAAETASDQNRDQRSLELFKAAADATSLVQRPSTSAPPRVPSVVPSAPPPAPAPSAPPRVGPTGTLAMQIPQAPATPSLPAVRSSPPMPPPSARAPLPQRPGPGAAPGTSGGPPAGTARAAAAQANAARPAGVAPQRPLPAAVTNARGVLKQTLPSEGAVAPSSPRAPAARPSPAAAAPSSAAKRPDARKRPLDDRFHFPDEEVTVQRDLAALQKPRPIHIESAPPMVDEAAAATVRAPPAKSTPPATRTMLSGGARAAQPAIRAPEPVAIANEATTADPTEHTPIDDLDEQTSVLAGDEPELDFAGSKTGETSSALLDSLEQSQLDQARSDRAPADDADSNVPDDGVTGEDASDPRGGGLVVPSVRPEPMRPETESARPEPVRASQAPRSGEASASAWTSMRVAVRREGRAVRVEPLARGARVPAGAVAAVLVAQDDATAEALARLLDG